MSDQNPNSAIAKEKVAPESIRTVFRSSLTWIGRHHEKLTVLLVFLTTIAAIVSTFVAIWAVRTQNKVSRELATQQNFLQFYEQWESEGMQVRRARLAAELLENPAPENIDDSPLVFLETLSSATKRGLVDRELVWNTFYVDVTSYWAAAEPYVQKTRLREQCRCMFEELETLSKQLAADEAKKLGNGPSIGHDAESVRRFLELERKRQLPEKEAK